ncbi:MAG: hypothetical protein M3O90_03360 [Actinomycetota bacterium]|nr:hypothetical protein [Actinomycetota bacterium]
MPRLAVPLLALVALLLPAGAQAAITPTRTATDLASAIAAPGTTVTGASFVEVPPNGQPNAVSDVPLGGFPLDGASYAILSSGDARHADPAAGALEDVDEGPSSHGGNAQDVTVLRVDLVASAEVNCLSLAFRFLSDEAKNDNFNDGFIAELDASDWTADPGTGAITAPQNFAFDPNRAVISVNSPGQSSLSPEQAAGTGYKLATPRLSAAQAIGPGVHSVFLSIFDQGDQLEDSAVFVDRLALLAAPPGSCTAGAQSDNTPARRQPVRGKSVIVGVVSGKVRVKRRGSSRFELLDGIEGMPVGSTVDASAGRVRLTSAAGAGTTQTAEFYKGSFEVLQGKSSALTELKLAGASLASCHFKRARASAKRKRPLRRLFGDGKGSFRTRGRHAAATVRGTKWLTQDTCKGTLVKVSRGTVKVRDFTRKRTVTVRQGHSYLARPPR